MRGHGNTIFFGKLASGDDFTIRTEEIIRLKNNFKSGINTIMISPRRWGKSSLVDNHPYHVQQLAQLCWLRCDHKMIGQIIDQALDSLTLQLGLLFQNLTESLSTTQANYLKALISEETRFSSTWYWCFS